MFNILKRNYPEMTVKIHKEFYNAADKILAEAKGILSQVEGEEVEMEKVDRMQKIGFRQAKQVEEVKKFAEQVELSKEQREMVLYYQEKYPLFKFITETEVKSICERYGLVCGEINRFTGFVPEKNLQEIENFKGLDKEDCKYIRITNTRFSGDIEEEASLKEYERQMYRQTRDLGNTYRMTHGLIPSYHSHITKDDDLKICAPLKDMDTKGMELQDGYKIKKKVEDPVVMHPCKGGYLILTAWGDEASDPIVVNQKFN